MPSTATCRADRLTAPRREERAVVVELLDAIVADRVRDEDVTWRVRRRAEHDGVRRPQRRDGTSAEPRDRTDILDHRA